MQASDFDDFSDLMSGAWEMVGRNITGRAILAMFGDLANFDLAEVKSALAAHRKGPRGRNPPTTTDILEFIQAAHPDGHPKPEEAWNLLLALVSDESETGFLTDEMRQAWAVCSPSLDAGDRIGARKAFLECYTVTLQRVRAVGLRPNWTISSGTDKDLQQVAIETALRDGKITAEYAAKLLPGPRLGLTEAAALLTGPPKKPMSEAARKGLAALRALAQQYETEIVRKEEDRADSARRANEYVREREARQARKVPPNNRGEQRKTELSG